MNRARQIELQWEVLLGREGREEKSCLPYLPTRRSVAGKTAGMGGLISLRDLLHLCTHSSHRTLEWLGYCLDSSCQVTGAPIMLEF